MEDPRVDVAVVAFVLGLGDERIMNRRVGDFLDDVRFKVDLVNFLQRRGLVFNIRMNSDVEEFGTVGQGRRIDGPEAFLVSGHLEGSHFRFFEQLIFAHLATATIHFLNEIRKMSRDEVPVVFEEIRLADADRIAELELVFNEIEKFARELARPTVADLLIVVHEAPRGEDVVGEDGRFVVDRVDRFVVRMLRIIGDLVDAVLCGLNRSGLFFVSLLNRALGDEGEDNHQENQNRYDDPKIIFFDILWFQTAFSFCHCIKPFGERLT